MTDQYTDIGFRELLGVSAMLALSEGGHGKVIQGSEIPACCSVDEITGLRVKTWLSVRKKTSFVY